MNKLIFFRSALYSLLIFLFVLFSFLLFVDSSFFLNKDLLSNSKSEFYLEGVSFTVSNQGESTVSCRSKKAFLMGDTFHFKHVQGSFQGQDSRVIPFKAHSLLYPNEGLVISMRNVMIDLFVSESNMVLSAAQLNWNFNSHLIYVENRVELLFESLKFISDQSVINFKDHTVSFFNIR